MDKWFLVFVTVTACSTSSDAGTSQPDATCVVDAGVTLTCDVSGVPGWALACNSWSSSPDGGSSVSCPAAVGWSTSIGGSGCSYDWTKSGPADICELPTNGTSTPFAWLHPDCDAGCGQYTPDASSASCTDSTTCASTLYCEKNGKCGGAGVCEPISGGIGPGGQVCGCDNKTYASSGAAHQARVSIAYFGACE